MLAVVIVLVALGIVGGIVLLARSGLASPPPIEADSLRPRIVAHVSAGPEQIVMYLGRVLGIALRHEDAGYGQLYIADSSETMMRFASRSEIDRGYVGEIRIRRAHGGCTAEYFIVAAPGDDVVHERLLRFDRQLVDAFRELDPDVRLEGPSIAGTSSNRRDDRRMLPPISPSV